MEVYLTASVGRNVWSSSWCALNRGFPLKASFTSPGSLSDLITIWRHNAAAIPKFGNFRTHSALLVISFDLYSGNLPIILFDKYQKGRSLACVEDGCWRRKRCKMLLVEWKSVCNFASKSGMFFILSLDLSNLQIFATITKNMALIFTPYSWDLTCF